MYYVIDAGYPWGLYLYPGAYLMKDTLGHPLIELEDDATDYAVAALLLARYKARLNKHRLAIDHSYD